MAKRTTKLDAALDSIIPGGPLTSGEDRQEAQPVIEKETSQATSTVKATYYIQKELTKRLKFVAVDQDRDLSNLVNEAINDLVNKYNR